MCEIKLLWTSLFIFYLCVIENYITHVAAAETVVSRRRQNPKFFSEIKEMRSDLANQRHLGDPGTTISTTRIGSKGLEAQEFAHLVFDEDLRRSRRNSTHANEAKVNSKLRKPGLRRRKLRPGSSPKPKPESEQVEFVFPVLAVVKKRTLDTDNENRNRITKEIEVEQKINNHPSPSFTNYEEPAPSQTSPTSYSPIDEFLKTGTPVTGVTRPTKKYYFPIFRKPYSTSATDTNSTSSENISNEEEKSEHIFKKKPALLFKDETTKKFRSISKVNPPLFSLRTVPDLDSGESSNPFLDGAAAPISSDLGMDHSRNLHSLHSLLTSDSAPSSHLNGPTISETIAKNVSADSSVIPTMPDDLQLSDGMPMPVIDSDASAIKTRNKKPPPILESESVKSTESTSTSSAPIPILSFSTSTTTEQNLEIETDPTTTSEATANSEQLSEISGVSGDEVNKMTTTELPTSTLSNPHVDFIITLAEDPPSTGQAQNSHEVIPAWTTSSEAPKTTQPPGAETNKVQRQTDSIIPSTSNSDYAPTSVQNVLQLQPNLNPFDLGNILGNIFQSQTPQIPQPQTSTTASINQNAPIGGLLDSLNSLYSLLGPITSSTSGVIVTTPRPFFTITTPAPAPISAGAPANASPLQLALNNMLNVFTNPFGTTEIGHSNIQNQNTASPIFNLLAPQPVVTVPITPTIPKPPVPLNPSDYLDQLLKLGSDLGINQDFEKGNQGLKKETPRNINPAFGLHIPAHTNQVQRQIPLTTTTPKPLFDLSSLLSGNWLSSGFTTTPAPAFNFDLLSLLTGNLLNPFNVLTTRQPSLFSFLGASSNQQPNVFSQSEADRKSGPYFWLDSNMFLPGLDEKKNPTTGIRPKLGQRDYFFRVK